MRDAELGLAVRRVAGPVSLSTQAETLECERQCSDSRPCLLPRPAHLECRRAPPRRLCCSSGEVSSCATPCLSSISLNPRWQQTCHHLMTATSKLNKSSFLPASVCFMFTTQQGLQCKDKYLRLTQGHREEEKLPQNLKTTRVGKRNVYFVSDLQLRRLLTGRKA